MHSAKLDHEDAGSLGIEKLLLQLNPKVLAWLALGSSTNLKDPAPNDDLGAFSNSLLDSEAPRTICNQKFVANPYAFKDDASQTAFFGVHFWNGLHKKKESNIIISTPGEEGEYLCFF